MLQKLIEETAVKYPNKLYGMLLFTEKDPSIIKLLKDEDYYKALHMRSGEQLDIFTTILFKGEFKFPHFRDNQIGYMMPIWEEPKQNKEILALFDIEDSREMPIFVLFGISINEVGIDYSFYHKAKINTENINKTYKSIEEIITIATDAVKILEESDKEGYNHDQLEKLLSKKIKLSKFKKAGKEVLKRLPIGPLFGKIF